MTDLEIYRLEEGGFRFHFVPTDKFKTITFVLKIKAPLLRETVTKRSLLSLLLKQGTKRYPSEKALREQLDMLYGASLYTTTMKKGNDHILHLQLDVANERFIEGENKLTEEALQLFYDLLFEPNLEGDSFPSEVVEQEKKRLTSIIESVYDHKIYYANQRLLDEMYKDEPFSLHKDGYVEDLEGLDGAVMYQYYRELLKEDEMDLYILGDFSLDSLKEQVRTLFTREKKHIEAREPMLSSTPKQIEPKEIVETDRINQAKLHIGYRTNIIYKDDEYPALQVFNGLFGAFPNSRLFLNVREKNSLAYYVSSYVESHIGFLLVLSGIDAKDYEKANTIIQEELGDIRKGNITEEELENSKRLIINQVKETLDSPNGTIELLYQQVIGGKQEGFDDLFAKVNRVTKEEVVEVSKQITLDTLYLLRGEVGEEDETNE